MSTRNQNIWIPFADIMSSLMLIFFTDRGINFFHYSTERFEVGDGIRSLPDFSR